MLVRALRLMGVLAAGRWRLEALAAECGVSTRTIRRDLAALEEAYLPVVHDPRSNRWSLLTREVA